MFFNDLRPEGFLIQDANQPNTNVNIFVMNTRIIFVQGSTFFFRLAVGNYGLCLGFSFVVLVFIFMKSCFAMTVAGSDCSGGAGVQADLKTFCRLGVYGLSAVTCVVAENAQYVGSVVEIDPTCVSEQIRLCSEAFDIGGVKTGMLPSAQIIMSVAELFSSLKIKPVIDPVMVASTGTPLVSSEAVDLLKQVLLPRCLVMMPNLHEAAILLNRDTVETSDFEDCAHQLADIYRCSVFLKGGHLQGNVARDILIHPHGKEIYEAEKITGVNTHGTGCTLSAAVTAALALGQDLPTACATAKNFVTQAIKDYVQTKVGKLLNHNTTYHFRMPTL